MHAEREAAGAGEAAQTVQQPRGSKFRDAQAPGKGEASHTPFWFIFYPKVRPPTLTPLGAPGLMVEL